MILQAQLANAERLCNLKGVRLTVQRRQVLRIVCVADKPIGAYEVIDALRRENGQAAPPTAYRALDFLEAQGLIHKLASMRAYIGCNHPDHPHCGQFLICRECGLVKEIEHPALTDSLHDAAGSEGFHADKPVVELMGQCAGCSRLAPVCQSDA